MSQPKGYVDPNYLDVGARMVQQIKLRSYAYTNVQPGQSILDVGCGPATDTIALGQSVGPTGHVVGVDYDAAMIVEANQRADKAGVGAWVEHRRADATALPWASGEFDACRSERLFQHLPNPEQALAEMARVTKPGGWVVVLDTDWGTLSTDTAETDIERRLARVKTERLCHNGHSGRQLHRLFKRQGLGDLTMEGFVVSSTNYALWRQIAKFDETEREALAAGIVTDDELQRWRTSLERASADDVFFGSLSQVLVAGRKA